MERVISAVDTSNYPTAWRSNGKAARETDAVCVTFDADDVNSCVSTRPDVSTYLEWYYEENETEQERNTEIEKKDRDCRERQRQMEAGQRVRSDMVRE